LVDTKGEGASYPVIALLEPQNNTHLLLSTHISFFPCKPQEIAPLCQRVPIVNYKKEKGIMTPALAHDAILSEPVV